LSVFCGVCGASGIACYVFIVTAIGPRPPDPLYDPYCPPPSAVAAGVRAGAPVEPGRRWVGWIYGALALSATLVAGGLVAWGIHRLYHDRDPPEAIAEIDTSNRRVAHPATPEEPKIDKAGPDAESKREPSPAPAAPSVPDKTKSFAVGRIEVVDVGLTAAELRATLVAQLAAAKTRGQKLLLMLTGAECEPCRGVDASLGDALMQKELAGVRLVRVDLRVFGEELGRLGMPTNVYPAFFLLSDDGMPVDAIHGGEWGEDVAANIAPVLGPFVRRSYTKRRHAWPATTRGIQL
jgi:hypothetical protein